MTTARKNLIDPASTPYYHCMARCVRRAFLCGKDNFSGKNYEHRRQWMVDRLNQLTAVFAIEICSYAVMSNHYHVVLHIHREQGKGWDTRDVLQRWTQLFSGHVLVQRFLANDEMSKAELLRVEEFAEEYRCRLLDISWFMRCLNEYLAREANKEDGSDTAIPFALGSYLELVDWTGRIVRQDKNGRISANTPPIFERLHIDPDEWVKTMRRNNRFRRAVGKLTALKVYAEKLGNQWVQGVGSSQSLYIQ